MASKNIVFPIALTSISSASVTGSYKPINSSGLPFSCFLIRIMNASDQNVTLSYDGTNDHEVVLANSTFQAEFQANAQPNNYIANLKAGTILYVKGTAGTGTIYLSGYYQPSLN